MAKVSIVLPVYNGERYLREAMDSILEQSYTDWELIVVDDCSVDRTAEIIDRYCLSDSRIHVIHNKKNQKLPQSLNIGFAASKGQYLTWTSDDNRYLPDALATMAGYLDVHNDVCMVRGKMDIIDSNGRVTEHWEDYSDEKMYSFNCLGACFMYRRAVREKIGDYNVDAFCVEDYDYWLRVLEGFGEIVPIDQILYQYRRHADSLSETRRKQVCDQLTKLRIRYADRIIHVLQNNKRELCRIYYEMRKSEYMTEEAVEKIKRIIPELCGETAIADKKYIVFGAGKYGEKAARLLGSRAVFFADNNTKKEGKIKCGLKILSFQNAICFSGKYTFLIAVSQKRIYEMIRQLWEVGIKQYSVYYEE